MPNGDLLISHENRLWIVPKGGGAQRKFADPGSFSWWFRWSPDGKVLRFTRNEAGTNGDDQEITADGNPRRMLTGWKTRSDKRRGNWTSDGKYFTHLLVLHS